MKLNTKGRYAVMAMVDLGLHSKDGQPVSLADIATRQEISLSYLEQLFARLRRAGLVTSARGPGGGYVLSHAADQTRIADIVLAVDEPIKVTRCEGRSHKGCMPGQGRCVTHDLWEELGNHIYLFLSAITLADVCERRVLGSSRAPVPLKGAGIGCQASEMRGRGSGIGHQGKKEQMFEYTDCR
jgi:Rrf2 family iron-sulfur cluster assembly transcriptional regulator